MKKVNLSKKSQEKTLARVNDFRNNEVVGNQDKEFTFISLGRIMEKGCRFRRYPPSHFGDTRSLFCCMTIQTG